MQCKRDFVGRARSGCCSRSTNGSSRSSILILTGLIALVVVFAVWNLALKIFNAVLAPWHR